jgi:hypothetical protein
VPLGFQQERVPIRGCSQALAAALRYGNVQASTTRPGVSGMTDLGEVLDPVRKQVIDDEMLDDLYRTLSDLDRNLEVLGRKA